MAVQSNFLEVVEIVMVAEMANTTEIKNKIPKRNVTDVITPITLLVTMEGRIRLKSIHQAMVMGTIMLLL